MGRVDRGNEEKVDSQLHYTAFNAKRVDSEIKIVFEDVPPFLSFIEGIAALLALGGGEEN